MAGGDGCTSAGVCWRGFGGPVTALCASMHAFRWLVRSFVRNTHTRVRAHTHQLTDGNKIGDEGAIALAAALEQNATLKELSLSKMIHVW